MLPLLIRTFVVYITLILFIRLSGKRQVGQLQLSELITAFLVSEVAASPLSDPEVPLIYAIVPILLLVSLEIVISFITTKSVIFKKLFEPAPAVLISKGRLNIHSLKKQRISADELLSSLRLNNVADPSTVSYCFLEHNGQLSSFSKDEKVFLPVIVDGKENAHFLKLIGRDSAWLRARMISDKKKAEELFLVTTDGVSVNYVEKEKKQ